MLLLSVHFFSNIQCMNIWVLYYMYMRVAAILVIWWEWFEYTLFFLYGVFSLSGCVVLRKVDSNPRKHVPIKGTSFGPQRGPFAAQERGDRGFGPAHGKSHSYREGYLTILVRIHWIITKVPSSMIGHNRSIGPPAKRHINGVLLVIR